jgi:hypothetical protein
MECCTRALQGVIFTSHELVKELIENAKTKTGLVVEAYISSKIYQTGKKVAKGFKESMQILFDWVHSHFSGHQI